MFYSLKLLSIIAFLSGALYQSRFRLNSELRDLLLNKSPFVLHVLLPLLVIFEYFFLFGLLYDKFSNLLILLKPLIKPFLPLFRALLKPFHKLMRHFGC